MNYFDTNDDNRPPFLPITVQWDLSKGARRVRDKNTHKKLNSSFKKGKK